MKASEKEKSAVAVETMTKEERAVFDEGVEGMRSGKVIQVLNLLLDQYLHHKPPSITEWSFFGPAEKLLDLMRERRGPDGIPVDAVDFVAWLKVPVNAKRVRAAGILVGFPPHPRNATTILVKLERAVNPDQYQPLVDGVRV